METLIEIPVGLELAAESLLVELVVGKISEEADWHYLLAQVLSLLVVQEFGGIVESC